MTKNTYNAKHIELGKKFLANKFVNADWDNDCLLYTSDAADDP